jgi:hypothetical protein
MHGKRNENGCAFEWPLFRNGGADQGYLALLFDRVLMGSGLLYRSAVVYRDQRRMPREWA